MAIIVDPTDVALADLHIMADWTIGLGGSLPSLGALLVVMFLMGIHDVFSIKYIYFKYVRTPQYEGDINIE